MVVFRRYDVDVYETRLSYLIQDGDGSDWLGRVAREVEDLARTFAPRRHGTLRNAHEVRRLLGTNQYRARLSVYNWAEHAGWVHEGTGIKGTALGGAGSGTWIQSTDVAVSEKTGKPMRKRMGPLDGVGPSYLWRQAGQRPKRWLDAAGTAVAQRYR